MKQPTIAVHNGAFHADDVFSIAVLTMLYPDASIIRTRDQEILNKSDIRVDVGGKDDPKTGDFDHHQLDGPGARPNGIPFASIGLIWKHYGSHLCESEDVAGIIDRKLIQIIDANDNGVALPYDTMDPTPYNIPQLIDSFNPSWYEKEKDYDASFLRAVEFARTILKNEIRKNKGKVMAKDLVLRAIQDSGNSPIIFLEHNCPWQEEVIENSEALYIIFPAPSGDWRVRAIPVQKGSFQTRKPLPLEWAGKNEEELARASGVKDAKFCHKDRFITGAYSLEGARELARMAVEIPES